MEKRVFKKLLSILMILMIISTDFFVLGSNLISYAAETNGTTNNKNISFSAYFKNEKDEKVENLTASIKNENLKMYAEITVKNDGYFNGELELQNSNFNLKKDISSKWVESIDGNKVKLKQINAGDNAIIELNIEPIITDTLEADMLVKASDLNLTGKYMETSYKGLSIKGSQAVSLNLQADSNAAAELTTDIITNKVFNIAGTEKRVVQLKINSRLSDNQYPIKETTISVSAPKLSDKLPEIVEVLSLGTMATNGGNELTDKDWTNNDGTLTITLKNEDEKIKWNKNAYDELIVTFIYASDVDANKVEITTNSEITVHNSGTKYTAKYMKGIENQELNALITTSTQMISEELFKGQLNSTADVTYNTENKIVITNSNIPEKVVVTEGSDKLTTESKDISVDTKYLTTTINKDKMLDILGQDGTIELKNGEATTTINKDTKADENGNIVVNYEAARSELTITTSKPQKAGVLEFKHSKAIIPGSFTATQIESINGIKTESTVKGIATINEEETAIVENSSEATLKINGTVSKAELTVSTDTLSTMATNSNVVLGIKLRTDDVRYDLFNNPVIKIQLPSVVESVKMNGETSSLYAEEFKVKTSYNNTNKTITMTLNGEQLDYPETSATQAYLQLNLDITLSKMAAAKKDKIVMEYTNENATEYYGGTTDKGVVEKEISIAAPSGLVTVNNLPTYNIEGISGINEETQIAQVANSDAGKNLEFNSYLINSTGANLKNVRILGTLPTDGNKYDNVENTLTTKLKSMNAENATIYYTENADATENVDNSSNGWKTNLNEVSNARKYLIKLSELPVESNYEISYISQLPNQLLKDKQSFTDYKVLYDTDKEKNVEVSSIKIGLQTQSEVKIETTLKATVGNDDVSNNATLKVGEVIKYTVTVKNTGLQPITNVEAQALVPEGTVYVEPEEGYVYSGTSYYTEKEDVKQIVKNIEKLNSNETYTFEYEVRVKSATDNIANKVTAKCGETVKESSQIINKSENSNIRVTVKRAIDLSKDLYAGADTQYNVIVENLSSETVKDLSIEMIYDHLTTTSFLDGDFNVKLATDAMEIKELSGNSSVIFLVAVQIDKDVNNVSVIAKVKDNSNNTYRSNKFEENVLTTEATVSLTSPQDKAYIKAGDEVQYNITVSNKGISDEYITVIDNVPEYLAIEEFIVNGETVFQTTDSVNNKDTYTASISNEIRYSVQVLANKESKITIKAKVKPITEEFDVKTISNYVDIEIADVHKNTSQTVTHILRGYYVGDIKNMINGVAWVDSDRNGQKDATEQLLSGVKVRIYDISTSNYLKDSNGNIIETTTNDKGEYSFTKIPNGNYIVLFEYDTSKYEPTYYMQEGVDDSINSKAILKTITIDGEEKTYAVTDTINLQDNISNINIGLKDKYIFDLELNKYITKVSIQSKSGTKSYDYNDAVLAKPEIKAKEMDGALVVLEYTIKVKNNGEIAGFVSNIVDYLTNGLTFSSELNPDWYISNGNLYTKKLANEPINPGETKEVKLILTKTMTTENTGVVNNRAEIYDAYNEYGIADVNSTPNNNVASENDMGSADVIIAVSTGGTILMYVILAIINTILIAVAIKLMIKNNIINIKKERR